MNKVLCKKDMTGNLKYAFNGFFKGKLYSYTRKNNSIHVYDVSGIRSISFGDGDKYEFSDYFYSPEETIIILRQNKIKDVLNG